MPLTKRQLSSAILLATTFLTACGLDFSGSSPADEQAESTETSQPAIERASFANQGLEEAYQASQDLLAQYEPIEWDLYAIQESDGEDLGGVSQTEIVNDFLPDQEVEYTSVNDEESFLTYTFPTKQEIDQEGFEEKLQVEGYLGVYFIKDNLVAVGVYSNQDFIAEDQWLSAETVSNQLVEGTSLQEVLDLSPQLTSYAYMTFDGSDQEMLAVPSQGVSNAQLDRYLHFEDQKLVASHSTTPENLQMTTYSPFSYSLDKLLTYYTQDILGEEIVEDPAASTVGKVYSEEEFQVNYDQLLAKAREKAANDSFLNFDELEEIMGEPTMMNGESPIYHVNMGGDLAILAVAFEDGQGKQIVLERDISGDYPFSLAELESLQTSSLTTIEAIIDHYGLPSHQIFDLEDNEASAAWMAPEEAETDVAIVQIYYDQGGQVLGIAYN